MKTPGQRVSFLRSKKGLSQKELAEEIHVSRDVVAKWENDSKRSIPNEALVSLADYFNVSTDYLLGRTTAKNPQNANAVDKYGLSENALSILENWYSNQKHNTITKSLNALIEDHDVLRYIAIYLYSNMNDEGVSITFTSRYKQEGDDGGWGDAGKIHHVDVGEVQEVLTNELSKGVLLLEIQDKLRDLLEREERNERFNRG